MMVSAFSIRLVPCKLLAPSATLTKQGYDILQLTLDYIEISAVITKTLVPRCVMRV